jgi:hypothetical protein
MFWCHEDALGPGAGIEIWLHLDVSTRRKGSQGKVREVGRHQQAGQQLQGSTSLCEWGALNACYVLLVLHSAKFPRKRSACLMYGRPPQHR